MNYKSILLHLDIDGDAAPLIRLAVDLAKRFEARLIGQSAADLAPPIIMAEGMAVDGAMMAREVEAIEHRIEDLHRQFESLAGTDVETQWRGAMADPTRLLVETARLADLVIIASPTNMSGAATRRSVDAGSLLLLAGRPVLVVSASAERLLPDKVLVAWNDTREARRAVADALPFLQMAKDVRVITISSEEREREWKSLADVVAFLSRHGVKPRTAVFPEESDGQSIADLAEAMGADLTISGAYGHSRLREWVFGGATRSLLQNGRLNRLLSN
jgi:nucleotide-binding universal stress UspA family protein